MFIFHVISKRWECQLYLKQIDQSIKSHKNFNTLGEKEIEIMWPKSSMFDATNISRWYLKRDNKYKTHNGFLVNQITETLELDTYC